MGINVGGKGFGKGSGAMPWKEGQTRLDGGPSDVWRPTYRVIKANVLEKGNSLTQSNFKGGELVLRVAKR